MNQAATREDIDEVIGIVKDFMAQSATQLNGVNKRLDNLDKKYDHLITVIDDLFLGSISTKLNWLQEMLNFKDCLNGREKSLLRQEYLWKTYKLAGHFV